jgi:hypothetical protein
VVSFTRNTMRGKGETRLHNFRVCVPVKATDMSSHLWRRPWMPTRKHGGTEDVRWLIRLDAGSPRSCIRDCVMGV